MLIGSLLVFVGISHGASVDIRGRITNNSTPRLTDGSGRKHAGLYYG
jgi:hypothetical protein